jgi:4-diphosphocytidyl-2-C-methyl-D-erythritol kinase
VNRRPAAAKLNLALVVGPLRPDGKHEVATVLQRIDLTDRVSVEPAPSLSVAGFAGDTLVRRALESLAEAAGVEPCWAARIQKKIPVAAGLGGGSSDAATALRLANATLERPLAHEVLHGLAAQLGADVPFFLEPGPQLGTGDGSELSPLDLPQDYWVTILVPSDLQKQSTASVYADFDDRGGEEGFEERRRQLDAALAEIHDAADLARLPGNDLASSRHAAELQELGAFRADVSGAGPAIYGLFEDRSEAREAARRLRSQGRTLTTAPTWYF